MGNLITTEQLAKICAKNKDIKRLAYVAGVINKICPLYGINNADILHEFLANILEECGEFTVFEENLNYSAKRLTEVWPTRFPTLDGAKPFEFNPKKLAYKVYGQRPSLGNITDQDGWDFRGSGPIQITGRNNITLFASYMRKRFNDVKTVQQWAELLRTDIEYGMHSACWIFAISFKLIDEAVNDEMGKIIKRINGGTTNSARRMKYYELCKQIIK